MLIISIFDILTGSELSFSLFYLAPILALTWYTSTKIGVFAAIAGSLLWLTADRLSNSVYSDDLIKWWNCSIRLGFFLIALNLLRIIKSRLEYERQNANTDSTTGLANSRYFYEALKNESDRLDRYQRPFTVVYIDLDGFKSINDTLGHAVGDEVLKEVADSILDATRRTDTVARLGGDEFVVLFTETDFSQAQSAITNLRTQLSEAMNKRGWPVTSSVGAVTYYQSMQSLTDMVKAADDLMYQVKKAGKNNTLHKVWEKPTDDLDDGMTALTS